MSGAVINNTATITLSRSGDSLFDEIHVFTLNLFHFNESFAVTTVSTSFACFKNTIGNFICQYCCYLSRFIVLKNNRFVSSMFLIVVKIPDIVESAIRSVRCYGYVSNITAMCILPYCKVTAAPIITHSFFIFYQLCLISSYTWQIVGIYRLCGSAIAKRELRGKYENDSTSVNLCPEEYPDVNVITGYGCFFVDFIMNYAGICERDSFSMDEIIWFYQVFDTFYVISKGF